MSFCLSSRRDLRLPALFTHPKAERHPERSCSRHFVSNAVEWIPVFRRCRCMPLCLSSRRICGCLFLTRDKTGCPIFTTVSSSSKSASCAARPFSSPRPPKGCQAPNPPKPLQNNNIHLSYELCSTRYTEYRNQKQTNPDASAGYPLCNLIFARKPSGMRNLQGAKIASRSIEVT
jgi:hypothetical protein